MFPPPSRTPSPPVSTRPRARAGGLAALLPALLWGACGDVAEAPLQADEPVTVELFRVEPETLLDVAVFGGQLQAEQSVMVKSETHGVIEAVLFEEGQPVREGEVLLRLRSREQAARLREAQAQAALAGEVFARSKKLVKRDATAMAKHDEAAAELEVARARVELVRVALERTEIRAPFDGVTGMRLVSVGDRVSDEDPLVQVDAIDRLELVFAMSDRGIVIARPGLPVLVRVLPYPDEAFPGEVFFVSPTIDPRTRRVTLKAWVPNEQHRLRPGLYANVDLQVARRENALLVPESAVAADRGGSYVWRVAGGGVAERVPVQTGLRKQGRVEITLGLQPGDRVVSAGTHKVNEGDRLAAAASTPDARGQARSASTPAERSGEGT